MKHKQLVLLPLAEQDIAAAIDHYFGEGGAELATRWVHDVEIALRHVASHPASGSQRYADMLAIPGLRCWPTKHFPYIVFYVERATQVDIWRVLHGHRDLAAWLREKE